MGIRIANLQDGEAVDSFFLVTRVTQATTRNGATYLTLQLRDVTGDVSARIWDPAAACRGATPGVGVYRVRGRVERFREEQQLNVDAIAPYEPVGMEFDEVVRCSRWSGDVLVAEIRAHVEATVRTVPLRGLLLAVLDHDEVNTRLPLWPAASKNHHAYRGGLAEHILSGMRLASTIAGHYAHYYPGLVSEEMLVAGVMLHDLAKIWEMDGGLDTAYTTPGKLVGHIPMGAIFVERVARERGDVPEALLWELQHLVLSHHGEYEYGSPKVPKTVEAQLLHYIDQIDAKANTFASLQFGTDAWTYDRTMRRPLYDPRPAREAWVTPPDPTDAGERGPGRPVASEPAAAAAPAGGGGESADAMPRARASRRVGAAAAASPVAPETRRADRAPAAGEAAPRAVEAAAPPVDADASASEPAVAAAEVAVPPRDALTLNLFDGL